MNADAKGMQINIMGREFRVADLFRQLLVVVLRRRKLLA